MLDLNRRGRDVRTFVRMLEEWLIRALADLNVAAERRGGRIGLWVQRPNAPAGVEDKIAAIGIRLHRWVSFHGISLNVAPDLSHYSGIVACGITAHGVTSLRELGSAVSMVEVDRVLRKQFEAVFGSTNIHHQS
jgi:lipoyl(octanoyl) transferase